MLSEDGGPVNGFKEEYDAIYDGITKIIVRMSKGISYLIISELEKAYYSNVVNDGLREKLSPYMAASGALLFCGRNIDMDKVGNLLEAVDIIPDNDLLGTLTYLNFKNYVVYLISIYYLQSWGKEVSVENSIRVVRVFGTSPDATLARFAIDFHDRLEKGEIEKEFLKKREDKRLQTLARAIESTSEVTTKLIISEFERGMTDKNILDNIRINRNMALYIIAAGTLAFAGRDIDTPSIKGLLEAIDVRVNEEYMRSLFSLHYKNHIIYLIGIYFLVAVGRKPEVQSLLDVIRAMYINPDYTVARYAIDLYNKMSTAQKTG